MDTNAKIGVFLCKCGEQIDPLVDLDALKKIVGQASDVAHCEIMSNPCLKPGIEGMTGAVVDKKLNRLIIAGCEGRLMLKKLEKELEPLELRKGQIDMVNLRGHVAAVSDLDPAEKAMKAAKLINASVAEMSVLAPSIETRANIEGPVMIVGSGIASFAAAEELSRQGIDYLLEAETGDAGEIVRQIHNTYPGERQYYNRLEKTIRNAITSPHATLLPRGKLAALHGVTGDYSLTFTDPDNAMERKYAAGAIVACLDATLDPPGPEFGHEGKAVMTQSEMEEHIYQYGAPGGNVVFWVSDYENDQPEFAPFSARSAWFMACHLRQSSPRPRTIILYNEQMEVPLTAAERALNRKLGIIWIPYDKAVRPAVTDSYITFCNLADHLEHEIDWECLVLSPIRSVAGDTLDTARILGLVHKEERFLTGHHARVRPEMVGREETYLAGSARYPCDLHEALTQGRRAANKTADIFKKSANGELFVPRVVCVVDPAKCIGCGQCQELCDCGGIGVADGLGGGLPRIVDPMVCTGGGTCAAACPYHALILQNNSNDQREARVAALASQLAGDETMAVACAWGGLPAADIAGKMGIKYDPRVHILGVPCVGQIDPCVMARAFKEGAPGLILVGCLPEECHHSYGVDHTWSRVSAIKKIMTLCGFDRRRIALAHADLNKSEEFIRTVESFNKTIAALGPIPKTPENQSKLDAMYDLIKYNTRVRHLLSVSLRRPWEDTYRGDQRHVLDYDRDFSAALTEEFLQHRILQIFRDTQKPYKVNELVGILHEEQGQVVASLWEMINNGVVDLSHENREAVYALHG
jgi:heterodisulfide reductase subunit A-like polyferredoxin/coenzyme F420-reducing hydrogenase delta subunit